VVHDFANLITLVSGYSEMLLSRLDLRDPARPELEEIRKAAARGAGMTAQILDFIRQQATPPTRLDLNALITEMVSMLRPVIGEHIRLLTALDPDLDMVQVDAAQLTRVIMNLVLNARDAMPHGGRITIRTANQEFPPQSARELPAGRYVTLEVADTGSGMDAQTVRRLFDPFFTTKNHGGTGLGLTTVQRLVRQAGGDILVRSRPGDGSTFTVCLPPAAPDGETARAHPRQPTAAGGTETILLAEDEESVRRLLKHLLSSSGYHVLDAADGHDALRLFTRHAASIDLLLTDVMMPGMNGRELAERARAAKPTLKVIYISGYTDDVLLTAGALSPGVSFLRKPLNLDALRSLVRELLDARAGLS